MDLSVFLLSVFASCTLRFCHLLCAYLGLSCLLVGCSLYHYVVSLLVLLKLLVILLALRSTLSIVILLCFIFKKINIYMVFFHTFTSPIVFKVIFFCVCVDSVLLDHLKKSTLPVSFNWCI